MLTKLRLLSLAAIVAGAAILTLGPLAAQTAPTAPATAGDSVSVEAYAPYGDGAARIGSVYTVEAYAPDGALRWREVVHNTVVNEGLDALLDKTFKGSSYTATWFCGLIDNANFTAINNDDTAARITTGTPSHPTSNNWKESTAYSNSTRPTLTLGSVSGQSVSNSASKCAFTINATATINGAFTVSNSTKGGTSGTIYSVTSFGATRSVISGDTLNVTITLTTSR